MVMTIAEDMKKLTENIIISNDVRVKALGDLVADAHETLKGFSMDRKKMAAQQAKDLAGFADGLSKNGSNMIKGFQKDHQQMSKEQAKSLADFVKNMAADVSSMLHGFQKARNEMSEELKDRLAKEVKEIETYVANKLKEFNKDHADMSEELKKELNGYVMGIVKETRMFLKECGSNMAQARKAWQSMSATMAKARKAGFPMPEIDAGERVTTVKQATRKAQGKKKTSPKSKGGRQKVGVGV
jgi:rubrerythrin